MLHAVSITSLHVVMEAALITVVNVMELVTVKMGLMNTTAVCCSVVVAYCTLCLKNVPTRKCPELCPR